MICFTVDHLTPCIQNVETGEIVETEVIPIKRESFLSKYNEKTNWIVDWGKLSVNNEIYALVKKGTVDIQGLVALREDKPSHAVYVQWAVVSPNNNKWYFDNKEYSGVGGHLLAIAVQKSIQYGFNGVIYGDAMDKNILNYFINEFGAFHIPTHINPNRFIIDEELAYQIKEVYNFEWSDFCM